MSAKRDDQSKRFMDVAREIECDDDPAALDHAMRALNLKTKKKPPANEAGGDENDEPQDD